MPTYYPIDLGLELQGGVSVDTISVKWNPDDVMATFGLLAEPASLLRITFDRSSIVRLLDEMPLSTEHEESRSEGLVADHFAYRVTGAAFEKGQSHEWKNTSSPVAHYRFITGWACMDVLSAAVPVFEKIASPGF